MELKTFTYQFNGITSGKGKNVGAGNDSRTLFLELCFGRVYNFESSQAKVGRRHLLRFRSVQKDWRIAPLIKRNFHKFDNFNSAVYIIHRENPHKKVLASWRGQNCKYKNADAGSPNSYSHEAVMKVETNQARRIAMILRHGSFHSVSHYLLRRRTGPTIEIHLQVLRCHYLQQLRNDQPDCQCSLCSSCGWFHPDSFHARRNETK